MVIFALDASTTAVGWCKACGDQYITSNTLCLSEADVWSRIGSIGHWLRTQLSVPPFANIVAYEEPHGDHSNRRTDRLLGVTMGIAFRVACECRCRFVRIHNAAVRATGFHKNAMGDVALLIGKQLDELTGDEADAVGVWQACLALMRKEM